MKACYTTDDVLKHSELINILIKAEGKAVHVELQKLGWVTKM